MGASGERKGGKWVGFSGRGGGGSQLVLDGDEGCSEEGGREGEVPEGERPAVGVVERHVLQRTNQYTTRRG